MRMTRHSDYERVIKFPAFANYAMRIVFADNLTPARMKRYGSAGAAGEPDTTAFVSLCTGGCHIFLKPQASAGIVAHESFHAVIKMLKWAEVREFDEEVIAYHLTYVVNQITDFQLKVLEVKSK